MTHPVDVTVGRRIRFRRWKLGITQAELAAEVGVRFQQIQKYETGSNRVSASRLFEIAQVLEVSIGFFFEGLEKGSLDPEDALHTKETYELLRAYNSLPEKVRPQLLDLIRSLLPDN